jgi:hypothetical protein
LPWPLSRLLRSRFARFRVPRRITITTTIITTTITTASDLKDPPRTMAPSTGAIFLCGVTNLLTVDCQRSLPDPSQRLWKRGYELRLAKAAELAGYQMLLTKKPNRGCSATNTLGGARCFFAILRFGCGFGSGFF